MTNILDNKELDEIMTILEEMDDEELSVKLLSQFNSKTKELGALIINRNPSLSHNEWKALCDKAQSEVDKVIAQIKQYQK